MKVYLNAFLQRNLGDDLFVHILLNRYKNHTFYTMTTDPTYRKAYPNLRVMDWELLVRVLRKFSLKHLIASHCDLALTLGGSVFIENPGDDRRNFSLGKMDHYVLGANFGPYKTQRYFDNVKGFLSTTKDICFREQYSYDLFRDLPQARVEPDIVFSLPLEDIPLKNEKHAVFSVISCKNKLSEEYDRQYLQTMGKLVNRFTAMGYRVTLMSFCDFEGDGKAIDRILPLVKDKPMVQRYDYDGNIQQALELLASSSVIVGSRFHANILGLLMNKAVIPFLYSDKTRNVLTDLGFEGLTVDIRKLDEFRPEMVDEACLSYRLDVSGAKASAEKHFMKLDERLLK